MGVRDIHILSSDLFSAEANDEDMTALEAFVRETVELCFASDPALGSSLCDIFGLDRSRIDRGRQGDCQGPMIALGMLRYACAEVAEGSSTHDCLVKGIRLLAGRVSTLQ